MSSPWQRLGTERPLTTIEVAARCYVSRSVVLRWIYSGQLKANSTPGGHFRILADDVHALLKEYGIPFGDVPPQGTGVLPMSGD